MIQYTNYSLEVISHHPEFSGKTLKKYAVDGIDTIGAYGNENFTIVFKNHTASKVQVKLSIDGVDILSGGKANTNIDNNMWVVNAYDTMSLKAWPETHQGGASFIFTNTNNSVVAHTHGDLSSQGIIAAAVFVESQPVYINYINYPWSYRPWPHDPYKPYDEYTITCNVNYNNAPSVPKGSSFGGITGSSGTFGSSVNMSAVTEDQNYFDAAVGAGQYTDQKLTNVAGLVKPILSETLRIKYMWWSDLVEKLKANNVPSPHASGFPGDNNKVNINLGDTPRIGGHPKQAFQRAQSVPVYSRI